MTIHDIDPELTQLYLRSICQPAPYKVRMDDNFILWRDVTHLKALIDHMQTITNSAVPNYTSADLVTAFKDYLNWLIARLPLTAPNPYTHAPSVTEGVIYDVLQYKMDPQTKRTVGRSWYPVFVINMKLYDTPQTHPKYGEYVAWSTHVIWV